MTRWLREFFASETAGGLVMLAAAALALLLANSPLSADYHRALLHSFGSGITLHAAVADGLMPLFFLMVGLELKHEMQAGALADPRQRILPLLAAAGGVVVPALIYLLVTASDPSLRAGWAIPTATDIAFAICVLQLLGRGVPHAAKIFLLALAIYDDLAAILIIALCYSHGLALAPLGAAFGASLLMLALNRRGVRSVWLYLALGATLAVCLHAAGIHTTVAGVITGLAIPLTRQTATMRWLHPLVVFAILPLFALVSAGVDLRGLTPASLLAPLPIGIALALLLGKPLGIFCATRAAVALRIAPRPEGTSWPLMLAVATLGGIGFTMSLFIGQLAFPTDPAAQDAVRLGVLSGSLLSALVGAWLLRRAR